MKIFLILSFLIFSVCLLFIGKSVSLKLPEIPEKYVYIGMYSSLFIFAVSFLFAIYDRDIKYLCSNIPTQKESESSK